MIFRTITLSAPPQTFCPGTLESERRNLGATVQVF